MREDAPEKNDCGTPPAAYSHTDAAEIDAITTLRSLLDSKRVRHDFRERDKYPNTDGYIEIVDEQSRPRGKVEVQIRSLKSGSTSCRCESSLVAYSKVTTLPVVLIGVDRSSGCAYWTHVSELTLGYEASQASFTVHFTRSVNSIDKTESCPCYRRWLELIIEYQERIQKYPTLEADIRHKVTLASSTPRVREALQRYVDAVNQLLDNDFITVKRLLFPTIWKFGVGWRFIDERFILYQISSIPWGTAAPLITELPESITPNTLGPRVHANVVQAQNQFLGSPEQEGRKFVFDFVKNLVRARMFPIHGVEMAADILFGFVRRYHRWLELNMGIDEYHVEDLRYALGTTLTKTTSRAARRLPGGSAGIKVVNLDQIGSRVEDNGLDGTRESLISAIYVVSSAAYPVSVSFDCLA
jgi:hypothetical protein